MAVLQSDLPAHLKPTASTLALFANDAGDNIYPSVARLAWLVGKTPRRITADLSALCKVGVLVALTPRSGGGRSTQYHLDVDALPKRPAFEKSPRRQRQGSNPEIPPTSASSLERKTPDVSDADPRRLEHRPLTSASETPDAHVSRSLRDLPVQLLEEQAIDLSLRQEIVSAGKQLLEANHRAWTSDELTDAVIAQLRSEVPRRVVERALMFTFIGHRLAIDQATRQVKR